MDPVTLPAPELFTLPSGDVLCYARYGDPAASATVFFNHGLPGSHVEAVGYSAAAKTRNICLVGIDRPGMGRSTFQPGRRVVDWPADLLALADHLKVDRFAVLGVSGGGPYAFACLGRLPRDRCVGVGVVASIYPMHLGFKGMMLPNRVLFNVAPWSPWLVEKVFEMSMGSAARDSEDSGRIEKLLDDSFRNKPEADRAAWDNSKGNPSSLRAVLAEDMRQALRDGSRGAAWDVYAIATDWGFRLEDMAVEPGRLVVWHGALDVNCPASMALKAREMVKEADWRISDSDGHFSLLIDKVDETMEAMCKMLE